MMQVNHESVHQQNDSFSEIANALRQLSIEQLSRHKVLALAASRDSHFESLSGSARLLENMRKQSVSQSLLEDIGEKTASCGLQVGLLKGAALWGDLYRAGEREASDIDLFVNSKDELAFTEILGELKFLKVEQSSSRISGFKTLFVSKPYGDLSVEVHTKLWWREPAGFSWQWRPALRSPFYRLSLEDQLIHLCGHWIAQHTMISMHWLFDIVLFLQKYETDLDETKLLERATALKVSRSVSIAREISSRILSHRGFQALENCQVDIWRYLWLKHRVQDSFAGALAYDFHWLKGAIWP
jgi:predicted nucleotidyltransferase